MKNICIVGVGYVGLVTGTCFADLGNSVICVDVDRERIAGLQDGLLPFFEPGLEELVYRSVRAGRLSFTSDCASGVSDADFVFVAVGTPSGQEGEADLQYVQAAAEQIANAMRGPLIVVNKSTMPIGTGDWVASIVDKGKKIAADFAVVSNPEFMREGSAVHDFLRPDRVVLGAEKREAAEAVAELYRPIDAPVLITDLRTAEMIKYASNAFLATKVSFINEIAAVCEQLGADVKEVARGMGMDRRIGAAFLDAGIGWGGSCFPKDVKALTHMAAVHGCHPQLLRAVLEINRDQRRMIVQKLRSALGDLDGAAVAILGLSFKPNTDDLREAPSLEIIHLLQHERANVRAYDPVAMPNAGRLLHGVRLCADAYDAADGADALVVVTEWNEFKQLDLRRIRALMRRPVILDGRNLFDQQTVRALGFDYRGVGRGVSSPMAVIGELTSCDLDLDQFSRPLRLA